MSKIGAVLLAAGCSRRFGGENKLVQPVGGLPIVRRVAQAVRESGLQDIVVVTGHDRGNVEVALAGCPVRFVHNDAWSAGMGRSISGGIQALGPEIAAAFVVPGDMPFLSSALLRSLVDRFSEVGGDRIVVPTTAEGAQRNPVLWPRRLFADLAALDGPEGGKALLRRHWSAALLVPVADESVFADIDTPEDLSKK